MIVRLVETWDRRQVPLYLAAIAVGGATGLAFPSEAPKLGHAIEPLLMLLLFATFLGVPLIELGRAFRDLRFLVTIMITNFAAVPLVAWGLSRLVVDDDGLLLGVLLVLLTPCIDYVIVFAGLAGGDRTRLLAATPLLMLAQMALLPGYLWLFAGPDLLGAIDAAPFLRAFLLLVVVPLAAAAIVHAIGRRRRAVRLLEVGAARAMVPLMMTTLAVVVASQISAVGTQLATLARLLPLYAAFAIIAVAIGLLSSRIARLDISGARAVAFSTATRNSLVVLPLALALPPEFALAPLAVVTQTLVELIAMVILVRLIPTVTGRRTDGIREPA